MCKAFSCLVLLDKSVLWEWAVDSHEALIKNYGLKDNETRPDKMTFCRVEYSPKNGDYLKPDKWVLGIDQERPTWWSAGHAKAVETAWKKWKARLDKILIYKPIVNPFKDRKPPKKITKKHLNLLRQLASVWDSVRDSVWDSVGASVGASVWDSVGDSVGDSVWDSVWASVGASVWASVGDSVRDSVRDSVGASVGDSVWAYIGSFFRLQRKAWKYTEKIKCSGYPCQSAVDLWEMGLVPTYDGNVWRLHGGPGTTVLWEGALEDKKEMCK
jgi:hypothetical protein